MFVSAVRKFRSNPAGDAYRRVLFTVWLTIKFSVQCTHNSIQRCAASVVFELSAVHSAPHRHKATIAPPPTPPSKPHFQNRFQNFSCTDRLHSIANSCQLLSATNKQKRNVWISFKLTLPLWAGVGKGGDPRVPQTVKLSPSFRITHMNRNTKRYSYEVIFLPIYPQKYTKIFTCSAVYYNHIIIISTSHLFK